MAFSSQDNGDVTIGVTLVDGDARLVSGDILDVYLNTDGNNSNGQSGFDVGLEARGAASGQPSFFLCRLAAPVTCEQGLPGFGTDTPTGVAGTHVVTFNVSTGVPSLSFFVGAFYTAPGSTTTLHGPGARIRHVHLPRQCGSRPRRPARELRRVPEYARKRHLRPGASRRLPGAVQLHPRVPSPCGSAFPRLPAAPEAVVAGPDSGGSQARGDRSGPLGAARPRSAGIARTKRFKGNFRYGAIITVRITKPAWVGFYARYQVTRRGLKPVRTACIPAVGAQKPMKCSPALRGK